MAIKEKLVKFAEDNRVIIAALSVLGSFAGLIFSGLDLQTSIQDKARKAELAKRPADKRKKPRT